MTLDELLKEKPEVLKEVQEALKGTKAKFVDLTDGGYVDSRKYADLETKYTELKNAPNPLEEKIKELEEQNKQSVKAERDKLVEVVRGMAIDNAINSLNIDNELIKRGIRAELRASEIVVDDDFKITGGLTEQIDLLKETYKDSLSKPVAVSTGQSLPNSNITDRVRTYNSADLDKMSVEEIGADLNNIVAQLGNIR